MNTFTDLLNEIEKCRFDFDCKFNALTQSGCSDNWDSEKVKEVNAYLFAISKCIDLLEKAKKGEF